jgi:methyl-accepting chemotaxis protein
VLFESRALAPVRRIRLTLAELSAGNFDARSGLRGQLAFERMGQDFDALLDDRVSGLERAARDSEELNDSVIEIMQAVGEIATRKDLTVRVPITENVTGAIADALNLLTEETRRVLINVRAVSQNVAEATIAVKGQSDTASKAAAREQREVELAARELAAAASALDAIASRARASNEAAERAVGATAQAMNTVAETVRGVARSRDLIRETEKRIKRLGERSQEIGQVVSIIQGIAERTGILALNASMHAAAAGEAGRSFAVVADEVKRLSESARESTFQIGRLVTAIQTETHDTVIAMNHAIAQVVEISRLADASGQEMRRTQDETEALAADVRDIARTSSDQAKVGVALQERARIIQEASGETARQLSLQANETLRLVDSARALLDEVSVFKVSDS